jgi:hypothetical protein
MVGDLFICIFGAALESADFGYKQLPTAFDSLRGSHRNRYQDSGEIQMRPFVGCFYRAPKEIEKTIVAKSLLD